MQGKMLTLAKMQRYDDQIVEKEGQKVTLPKQLSDLVQAVESAKAAVTQNLTEQEELVKRIKQIELDIKSNGELIKKYSSQLAEVKNNKEYKALNSEVTNLKAKNSDYDSESLKIMDAETELKAKKGELDAALKVAEEKLSMEEGKLRSQIDALDQEISTLREKRNEHGKTLPIALMKRYKLLIQNKDHKAVVFNKQGACSGCGFKIRPQQELELKQQHKLVVCESCGRMLIPHPRSLS